MRIDTVPQRIKKTVEKYPTNVLTLVKDENSDFQPTTYSEFYDEGMKLILALLKLGVKRGEHIGIISDNRKEWLLTDFAVLSLGAVDVPKGSDSTSDEIGYILNHAGCTVCFSENIKQTNKIISKIGEIPSLKTIILYDTENLETLDAPDSLEIISYKDLQAIGVQEAENGIEKAEKELMIGTAEDLATFLYTSGTTGAPKGVMLTHESFIFQVDRIPEIIPLNHGEILLSVLPIWHSYERAVTYVAVCRGLSIAYSKPIGSILLADLGKVRPHWMTSVPRIWDGVRTGVFRQMENASPLVRKIFRAAVGIGRVYSYFYNLFHGQLPHLHKRYKILEIIISIIPLAILTPVYSLASMLVFKKIRARLGGRFKAGISGGGALADYIDSFFQAAGILLLEGYGLTETGPVLAARSFKNPVKGTVGKFLDDIEYRVIDKKGAVVHHGRKGVLHVKSPQVMKGYYREPEKTEAVLKDGWLNTGDIVVTTVTGECRILGREKDTIVLTGGENIEPVPIEDKIVESRFIDQVMVVGQDQKFLGALIVPNYDELEKYAEQNGMPFVDGVTLCDNPAIQEMINEEIQELISFNNGFKGFERIFRFHLLKKPFEAGLEMTQKLSIKRHVISKMYRKEIAALFN